VSSNLIAVTGTGQFVRLKIDTAGFFDGESFDLKLRYSAAETTELWDDTPTPIAMPANITDGSINVVPEPLSLSLLACGGIAMLRRRRK
jgi:hypothetical protein